MRRGSVLLPPTGNATLSMDRFLLLKHPTVFYSVPFSPFAMKTVLKFSMLVAVVAISGIPLTSSAHAYGGRNQQWQVTVSANCNVPSFPACGGFISGFWGWCEFGGTNPTAQSGDSGDCQVTVYGRQGTGMPQNPAHNAVDVTGWHIGVVEGMAPYAQFIIDSATVKCTGPGASGPSCFGSMPFPQPTGIPGSPGHYDTLAILGVLAVPGVHFNAQVNLLP